jgi:cysteinyl-tRNA synthetase
MLKIYNTLTRKKETFTPKVAGKVGMYVCGMTVYDYCHIGHARVMVVFDTVARYFRYQGYELTYVRNVTDIDDKIIHRANENGEEIGKLTERFIAAMHQDERDLNVLPPDIEPKATQSIADIITIIEKLIANGFAYVGKNGDVFYAVNKFANYGQLSGKKLDELQAGERVDVDEAKNNPLDFVLWKMAKTGEPFWESPWGNGRPGWHIECSAMSTCCLGNHFDIHGGGMDLQFPHHENEIAQSEGATGEKFVNLWMHNGFVRVNEEKMSKSLGNFFTVREVLNQYKDKKQGGEIIRFFVLSSHYRSPLNYSMEQLAEAKSGLTRLYTALRGVKIVESEIDADYKNRFEEAMNDDFNTREALSVLFDLARELNKAKEHTVLARYIPFVGISAKNTVQAAILAKTLTSLASILGLLQDNPESFLKGGSGISLGDSLVTSASITGISLTLAEEYIEQQIQARLDAKAAKNWAEADRIRESLKQQGVVLEDMPGNKTSWRREG